MANVQRIRRKYINWNNREEHVPSNTQFQEAASIL
jgi:hypothetical protein